MTKIKVLDCTLRDGGYINNWAFCCEKSKIIIDLLQKSNIDYIETGFLQKDTQLAEKTLFNSIELIKNFLPENFDRNKLLGMITYSKFPIDDVVDVEKSPISGLRVIFKKSQMKGALEYCKKVKEKGYKLFINPTFTNQYTDEEILILLNEIEKIHPYGFAIVDSMGVMKEKDILRLYYLIDNNLSKDISLCFHSHNNLQLSFSNAQCLIKICRNRELIIDSTVFGMGRGAGNLCTELITQYINDNYGGNYNLVPILKIVDEHINPIFEKTPWGYSVPYYLAATNHCHPNYAKYLVDKQTVPVEIIDKLLRNIPNNKQPTYDEEIIKQIYLDNFSNSIDDTSVIEFLNKSIENRKVLVLASGKTLETEKDKIEEFIKEYNPYIISLNFVPENFDVNAALVTNIKRYMSLPNCSKPVIITSNVNDISGEKYILNYSKYLNDSKLYDNIALMFLKLLTLNNVKEVYFAGLDGFDFVNSENYVDTKYMMTTKIDDFIEKNNIMSEQLSKFNKDIKINFVTNTKYIVTN